MHELRGDESSPADWDRLRPVLDDVLDQLDARERGGGPAAILRGRPFAEVARRCVSRRCRPDAGGPRAREAARFAGQAGRDLDRGGAGHRAGEPGRFGRAGRAGGERDRRGAGGRDGGRRRSGAGGVPGIYEHNEITIGIISVIAVTAIGTAVYEAAAAKTDEQALAGGVTAAVRAAVETARCGVPARRRDETRAGGG